MANGSKNRGSNGISWGFFEFNGFVSKGLGVSTGALYLVGFAHWARKQTYMFALHEVDLVLQGNCRIAQMKIGDAAIHLNLRRSTANVEKNRHQLAPVCSNLVVQA